MLNKRTPLRQIQFSGQGYSVVHHRISAYNRVIPPFIKDLRSKTKTRQPNSTPPVTVADTEDSTPPDFDNLSDSSDSDAMEEDTASEKVPLSGTSSDEESSSEDIDETESLIKVRLKSI